MGFICTQRTWQLDPPHLMLQPEPMFRWIDSQAGRMADLISNWAEINSGTSNIVGVARMCDAVTQEISALGKVERIDLPAIDSWDQSGNRRRVQVGPALRIVHRAEQPRRVLLNIHLDTVYGIDDTFQHVEPIDANTLRGPGVADAKGGLIVVITALQALQKFDALGNAATGDIGWTLALNPDEEIGSPVSSPFLIDSARNCQFGLLYEPALPDGGLVKSRKASSNFVAVIHGRSAHAGRDLHLGANAIAAASELTVALQKLTNAQTGVGVNVGHIQGGGPLNVVPALATVGFNIRSTTDADQQSAIEEAKSLVESLHARDGIRAELHTLVSCPAKPASDASKKLLGAILSTAKQLDLELPTRPSGGVSDGNRLAAAGLPNIDTLGPRGGDIHSHNEFLKLDSLPERAKLTALLLARFAAGELDWPTQTPL